MGESSHNDETLLLAAYERGGISRSSDGISHRFLRGAAFDPHRGLAPLREPSMRLANGAFVFINYVDMEPFSADRHHVTPGSFAIEPALSRPSNGGFAVGTSGVSHHSSRYYGGLGILPEPMPLMPSNGKTAPISNVVPDFLGRHSLAPGSFAPPMFGHGEGSLERLEAPERLGIGRVVMGESSYKDEALPLAANELALSRPSDKIVHRSVPPWLSAMMTPGSFATEPALSRPSNGGFPVGTSGVSHHSSGYYRGLRTRPERMPLMPSNGKTAPISNEEPGLLGGHCLAPCSFEPPMFGHGEGSLERLQAPVRIVMDGAVRSTGISSPSSEEVLRNIIRFQNSCVVSSDEGGSFKFTVRNVPPGVKENDIRIEAGDKKLVIILDPDQASFLIEFGTIQKEINSKVFEKPYDIISVGMEGRNLIVTVKQVKKHKSKFQKFAVGAGIVVVKVAFSIGGMIALDELNLFGG